MIRTLFAALVLTATPLAASAECSRAHQAAMSCPAGQVWDKDAKSCVMQTS